MTAPGSPKRCKKDFAILAFSTYEDAMEMESFCRSAGIPGRLIPLPPQIDAGCGLCWKMEPGEWEAGEPQIRAGKLAFEGPHTVSLWTLQPG